MKKLVLFFGFLFTIISCEENEIIPTMSGEENLKTMPDELHNRAFKGQFIRYNPETGPKVENVILEFEDNRFSGTSEGQRFPAICNGRYEIIGNEIEFFNECMWTADFDWTLILGGKYKISTNGNELVLTQSRGGVTDTYILKKQ